MCWLLDDVLATPMINQLEQKFSDKRFVRVDSDVVENLIRKDDTVKNELTVGRKTGTFTVFQAVCPEKRIFRLLLISRIWVKTAVRW
jgi:molecular chaperone HtpG